VLLEPSNDHVSGSTAESFSSSTTCDRRTTDSASPDRSFLRKPVRHRLLRRIVVEAINAGTTFTCDVMGMLLGR
jgi:hypothetical protein